MQISKHERSWCIEGVVTTELEARYPFMWTYTSYTFFFLVFLVISSIFKSFWTHNLSIFFELFRFFVDVNRFFSDFFRYFFWILVVDSCAFDPFGHKRLIIDDWLLIIWRGRKRDLDADFAEDAGWKSRWLTHWFTLLGRVI